MALQGANYVSKPRRYGQRHKGARFAFKMSFTRCKFDSIGAKTAETSFVRCKLHIKGAKFATNMLSSMCNFDSKCAKMAKKVSDSLPKHHLQGAHLI